MEDFIVSSVTRAAEDSLKNKQRGIKQIYVLRDYVLWTMGLIEWILTEGRTVEIQSYIKI